MVLMAVRRLASSASVSLKGFQPLFDRVLVEKFVPETTTKGGIMLPEKAVGKVLEANVVAAGPGARDNEGKTIPMNVAVGDRVLLPQWGENKIIMDEKEYYMFRESELLGVWKK